MRRYEYLKYILDNIDSPRAGFCYDTGHHHYWHPKCICWHNMVPA